MTSSWVTQTNWAPAHILVPLRADWGIIRGVANRCTYSASRIALIRRHFPGLSPCLILALLPYCPDEITRPTIWMGVGATIKYGCYPALPSQAGAKLVSAE
jgi:hypothetical protein